jgi:hypothetical protein
MKKAVIVIIAALALLYFAFKVRVQNGTIRFIESNETREREQIHDFLSQ